MNGTMSQAMHLRVNSKCFLLSHHIFQMSLISHANKNHLDSCNSTTAITSDFAKRLTSWPAITTVSSFQGLPSNY